MNTPPNAAQTEIRSITWPFVAYQFVRELPDTMMIVVGGIIAALLITKAPGTLEPLAAVIVPAIISAFRRSRPADGIDTLKITGGIGALFLKWKAAIAVAVIGGYALLNTGCTSTGAIQPSVSNGLSASAKAVICFLDAYGQEIKAGRLEAIAIADGAAFCGLPAVEATGILDQHRKTLALEGYVKPPAPPPSTVPKS